MTTEGWRRAEVPVTLDEAGAGLSSGQTALMERLARRLINLRPMRWSSLKRFAKKNLDRVDVERTVMALYRAGWLELRYKRGRTGDREPTQLRLLDEAVDPASALIGQPSPSQRQQAIDKICGALVVLRDRGGAPIPERVLVRTLFGHTKAVRLRELRGELEAAVGVPLETLVRFHVDVALTAGPVRYRYRDVEVDLRGSEPWAAITEPVASALTDLRLNGVDELVCVENQTAFESLLYEGLAQQSVVLFTSGFLGTVQKHWIRALVAAGIRRVRHWGDLDPWGLEIYRDLATFVNELAPTVDVRPWRMGPEPLERQDVQKLTTEDWIQLHRYLKRPDARLRETAEAMKRLGCKLEQEALLTPGFSTQPGD